MMLRTSVQILATTLVSPAACDTIGHVEAGNHRGLRNTSADKHGDRPFDNHRVRVKGTAKLNTTLASHASSKEIEKSTDKVIHARQRRDPSGLPGMPRRLLVAEDESLLARALAADLTRLGYTVIGPAPNGDKAVELARREAPDMALMDIRMPIMDGLAASHILFEELHVPVVFLSAYSDEDYLHQGMEVGAFGYLLKPVNLEELRLTLAIAWSRYLQQYSLVDKVDRLERKLEERKLIERAKGLIMQTLHVTEEEAMRRLQRAARDARRPMADLAQSVLDAQSLITDPLAKPGKS